MGDYSKARTSEPKSLRKIFVGGLNYSTTDETLNTYFASFGEIVDSVVMTFPDNKRSRGFGFVEYSSLAEVDACQNARPHKLDGKTVETKRATPREESGGSGLAHGQSVSKLFVGGIKEEIEEEDMRDFFSEFGTITDLVRMKDKETGRKKGFGFVEFNDYDPVDKLVLTAPHKIKGFKIDVKKALPKEDARKQRGGMQGGYGGGQQNSYGGYGGGNQGGYGGGQGGYGGGQSGYGGQNSYGGGQGGFGNFGGGAGGSMGGYGAGGMGGGFGGMGGMAAGGMSGFGGGASSGGSWNGGEQGGWGGGYSGGGGGPMRNGGGGGGRGGPYQGNTGRGRGGVGRGGGRGRGR